VRLLALEASFVFQAGPALAASGPARRALLSWTISGLPPVADRRTVETTSSRAGEHARRGMADRKSQDGRGAPDSSSGAIVLSNFTERPRQNRDVRDMRSFAPERAAATSFPPMRGQGESLLAGSHKVAHGDDRVSSKLTAKVYRRLIAAVTRRSRRGAEFLLTFRMLAEGSSSINLPAWTILRQARARFQRPVFPSLPESGSPQSLRLN